jgi:hypothetical protein
MPVLVPQTVTPPPPPRPAVSTMSILLRRAGLPDLRLDDSTGIRVLKDPGPEGFDDPTIDIAEDTSAGQDGTTIRQVRAEPREVMIPVYLKTASLGDLRALKDRIRSYTNPRLGAVTVVAQLSDGSERVIDGTYRSGMDGAMSGDTYWTRSQKMSINVHCAVPWWRAAADWRVEWATPTGRRPLLPILPLAPGKGSLIGNTNPTNYLGQVETRAVWTIVGPLTTAVFTEELTGRSFTFAPAGGVGSGDRWVIDTRRGRAAVYDPDGLRQRGALNKGADLFPIAPGGRVRVETTGEGSATKIIATAPLLFLAA